MTPDIDPKNSKAEPPWVGQVLQFWFEELTEADWFGKSDSVDRRIRERFLSLHERLMTHDGLGVTEPHAILAVVIVLDQFSRNLFRGSPRTYSADSIARRLARTAIERGFDIAMTGQERLFLYLPFEHSEDRADQSFYLNLVKQLGREDWTRFAVKHKAIIDQFGRFPHRNAVLNRPSTADEIAFLKDPKNSF
ncbi:MAG TPA: DUF924 family protein [Steroidobacteraceae bacterium]|jgi:uncharacterized protein (DUF924 family)|nr:DUF924 family protein [Steroidobacteraceae bacterium]